MTALHCDLGSLWSHLYSHNVIRCLHARWRPEMTFIRGRQSRVCQIYTMAKYHWSKRFGEAGLQRCNGINAVSQQSQLRCEYFQVDFSLFVAIQIFNYSRFIAIYMSLPGVKCLDADYSFCIMWPCKHTHCQATSKWNVPLRTSCVCIYIYGSLLTPTVVCGLTQGEVIKPVNITLSNVQQ